MKFTIADVLKARGGNAIWDLSDDHTVQDAVDLITKHNAIHAVPIYRLEPHESTRHSHSKCYYGILTARDLLKFILGKSLVESAQSVGRTLISELGGLPDCRVVGEQCAVGEAIEAFKRDPVGVLVQRDSSYSFLAPIDVLRFMYSEGLIKGGDLPVTGMERGMTVRTNETMEIGFSRLLLSPHNALAIVDVDRGTLVGNLSISDFFLPNHPLDQVLSDLKKPIGSKNKSEQVYLYHGGREGLEKMLSLHIHQLWMVDSESKPVGTVTLSNILHNLKL